MTGVVTLKGEVRTSGLKLVSSSTQLSKGQKFLNFLSSLFPHPFFCAKFFFLSSRAPSLQHHDLSTNNATPYLSSQSHLRFFSSNRQSHQSQPQTRRSKCCPDSNQQLSCSTQRSTFGLKQHFVSELSSISEG